MLLNYHAKLRHKTNIRVHTAYQDTWEGPPESKASQIGVLLFHFDSHDSDGEAQRDPDQEDAEDRNPELSKYLGRAFPDVIGDAAASHQKHGRRRSRGDYLLASLRAAFRE